MITIEHITALEGVMKVELDGGTSTILFIGGFPAAIMFVEWHGDTFYAVKKKLWKRDEAYTESVTEAFQGIENVTGKDAETHITRFARVAFDREIMRTMREGAIPRNYRTKK